MKTTNRVRKNHTTATAVKQPKTKTLGPITLLFYSWDRDKPLASVDISGKKFDDIKYAARKLGLSVGRFISIGVTGLIEEYAHQDTPANGCSL